LSLPADTQKIARFHQPIAANGLYWTAAIPHDGFRLSKDGRSARVDVRNYAVLDQPKAPVSMEPTYRAILDFQITWKAHGPLIGYTEPKKRYKLRFYAATAQIAYTARVPERNLTITSDPIETSSSVFAMMGTENNGVFF
jgi:hypothetical protein